MPAKKKSTVEEIREETARETQFDNVINAVEDMRGSIQTTLDQTRQALKEALTIIKTNHTPNLDPVSGAYAIEQNEESDESEEMIDEIPAGLGDFEPENVAQEWQRAMDAVKNAVLETNREIAGLNQSPEREAKSLEKAAQSAMDSMSRHMEQITQAAMPVS